MKPRIRLLTIVLFLLAALVVPTSCNNEFEGSLPRRDQLNYPIGVTFHPNGRYLYVVNSNFDARYRPSAGGTVSVIDADTLEIAAEQTPFLPSFGAFIELNEDASKAYVTARADDVVVAYEVADDGSALFCTGADGAQTSDPAECVIDRVPDQSGGAELPPDPFALSVFTVERGGEPVDVINTTHLQSRDNQAARVSSISLPGGQLAGGTIQTAPFFRATTIARRPGTQNLYVGARSTNGVGIFQPFINEEGEVEAIIQRGFFELNHGTINNNIIPIDARGMAFNDAGDRLYVVTRRPDAMHVVKLVAADPDEGTGTSHEVASALPLPDGPSDIVLHTTPQGRQLAYISSFDDESIQVVDVDSLTITDEILLDASPYEMAIEPPTSGCSEADERCRLFVTLFDDAQDSSVDCASTGSCGSVAVIDINPLNRNPEAPELSRYHTVISKIQ
ncbi:hypothetical protein FIV42_14270 [Persicimonas caeni]|uniref:YncE family protein n=1 Tax=Persicimonas caeni TaxID=2292766 RepID=A0A4Y6PU65_PERCE|nr:hypothetical protein [Persicimonas caeni]QDG51862.1 hypothetical protein FIV42_14270 [Persicimonas caeni]QED33083.1 hypothetical protein FRD00_14265 [Persicimonas caeni]